LLQLVVFDKLKGSVYTSLKANRAAPTGHLDCPAAVTLPGSVLAPLPQAAPRERCACWLTLILYYKNAQNNQSRMDTEKAQQKRSARTAL